MVADGFAAPPLPPRLIHAIVQARLMSAAALDRNPLAGP
jgi:hypothetical protein